ncbi:hypothetical protein DRZ77_02810 [Candidatus Woesearchaeota archaeon]|nr:ABC transporter ATP-binding protein [Candidatus Woesearchaeota archaeon]RLE40212.1 MAG: hypothetical protein DRZ77_02810 [Candidatus Woesearchaeota archaeon]
METAIKFIDIKKAFNKKVIFENVNLEVKRKEIFGIIGMSGSGKTTLLNTLIGFYTPDAGDILFYSKINHEYKSVFNSLPEVRRTFGFATQVPSLYPKLTVKENLAYFSTLHRIPKQITENNISVLLDITELSSEKNKLVQNLSEGMKKRLSIACALIHNPSILLLDEPTADLDPLLRKEIWRLVERVHRSGTTIIMASHFLDEIEAICHRVAVIHNGRIIPPSQVSKLKSSLKQDQEILLRSEPGNYHKLAKLLAKSKRVKKLVIKGRHLSIKTDNSERLLSTVISAAKSTKEKITELKLLKSSLESVFEQIHKLK